MSVLPRGVRKIWHPEIYQGRLARRGGSYFEGWYYKNVSATGDIVACIPGVSFKEGGNHQAFIQLINGWNTQTDFFSYPLESFTYSKKTLDLRIGASRFTDSAISLHIDQNGRSVRGNISFSQKTPLHATITSPGIMGWYAFVPFMECYHGIISLNHHLSGSLSIDDRRIDFTGGRGYIEKDWGTSFPSSWIWLQTNHFATDNTSFMLSVARIPWVKGSFIGFLCVLHFEDVEYRFATYTGSRIDDLQIVNGTINVKIAGRRHNLTICATQGDPAGLKAPVNGGMDRIITESVTSEVYVQLQKNSGEIIFEETGAHGGMEIAGNTRELYDGIVSADTEGAV